MTRSPRPSALGLALASALLLLGCGDDPRQGVFNGYVEADYVRVGATQAGRIASLSVERGDTVAAGAPLFTLDATAETAARDEAAARLAQARAQLDNLLTGRRPEEIRVTEAQLAEAEASLRFAQDELTRQSQLAATPAGMRRNLDETRSNAAMARARVEQLRAQLAVARLPAREDEIAAARAAVTAAESTLAQAEWRLGERAVAAPVGGMVEDTLYRAGETVATGTPVVSLLPPANVKVRFFVPEPVLPSLRIGQRIAVSCDGCPAGLTATVSFIAPEAEYTPPVIYSIGSREKLVYMIEARPDGEAGRLHPGQPVEVRLNPP